jgi:dipeptidyl aminopeptidase/acylaminoacyl peptidase
MYPLHAALKKPFFGRYQQPWRWPEGADQTLWERVIFPSRSGARLKGLLRTTPQSAVRGALVLAHPMGNAAKGFWLRQGHADWLLGLGYHVLVFDFNGFGESVNGTFDYPGDVLAAGAYLTTRFPDLPLGIVGASFGAGWSLCALEEPGHPFRAAVLEGVFPTLPDFWHRYPLAQAMLRVSQVVYPPWERRLRPIRAAANLNGGPSVLLVYGAEDSITPPAFGEQLRDALQRSTEARLVVLPAVAHTFALRDAPTAYCTAVGRFFEQHLARG